MLYLRPALRGGRHFPATLSCRFTAACVHHAHRQYVTFEPFQFQHHWEDVGSTVRTYNYHPLAQLEEARRGAVLENWARRMLQDQHFVEDAVPGTCVDGTKRSLHRAEYDFLCDGRRVEIKSARLLNTNQRKRWHVCFQFSTPGPSTSISSPLAFDDLYLVIFSPKWLHLVKHDMQTGVSSRGDYLRVSGKHGSWEESLDLVLDKLCTAGACELIGKTDISDVWIADETAKREGYARQFYRDKPFSFMGAALRGVRIEQLVREIDQLLHPGIAFSYIDKSVDWIRGQTRVEMKSSQLQYNSTRQYWLCHFSGIKQHCFHELLLAIYSPRGLDIFRHDGSFGLATMGVRTEIKGKCLRIRASQDQPDPLLALQQIEGKLMANHCDKIASILWDVWASALVGSSMFHHSATCQAAQKHLTFSFLRK